MVPSGKPLPIIEITDQYLQATISKLKHLEKSLAIVSAEWLTVYRTGK